MGVKVAIVGAGVNGLSCANVIQEKFPEISVTLFADKFSPGTTSDGAAGLWWPVYLSDTSEEEIYEYAKSTWKYLETLWNSPLGGKIGISLMPCIQTSDTLLSVPPVSDLVYGFQSMSNEELASYNKPQWKQGFRFVTFVCEGSKLLPFLLQKFVANKGVIIAKHVETIDEIASHFDIIINCSGLGAKKFNSDQLVHPIRGQILRVKAPWMKTILMDESDNGNYVIPNQETVVLGGTHDKDQWDTNPRDEDIQFIRNGCNSIFPSLKNAEIVYQWVGLRPGRDQLRVARENLTINGKKVVVLHNYGHGGSGLTLFHGCAIKVAGLLEKALAEELVSKL